MERLRETIWFPIATGAGIVVVIVAAAAALVVLPLLSRVDRTLDGINETLPLLKEISPDVDRIEQDLDARIVPGVDHLQGQLGDVDRGIGQLRDPIDLLNEQIAELQRSVAPLAALPAVEEEVTAVREEMQVLRGDVATIASGIGDVHAALLRVLTELQDLTAAFATAIELLDETEKHVENIDRKTGPAPPALPTPAPPAH